MNFRLDLSPVRRVSGLFGLCLPFLARFNLARSGRLMAVYFAAATLAHAQETVVANYQSHALLVVNLSTGARSVLSSATIGTGPAMNRPVGIARETNGNILVSEDLSGARILRIDPATGNRSVVSGGIDGSTIGTGPAMQTLYGLAIDASGNIIATSYSGNLVLKVDPVSGDRTVLGSSSIGSGAALSGPWGVAVEPDGNLVIAQYNASSLIRLNPTTGVRTVISSAAVGSGTSLTYPTGLARLANGSYAVVNVSGSTYILGIDGTSGARTALAGTSLGTGPTVGTRYTVSFDTSGNFYTADFSGNAIVRIDAATGNRTTVASGTVGSGEALNGPLGILPTAVASVTQTSTPPAVTSAATSSGTYGSSFSYTVTASNSPTSFSATALPTGLNIASSTGVISGTPTQSGSFTVTLGAINGDGTGNATLTLTIAKKTLTVTGVTASDKTYDTTTTAIVGTSSAALVGIVSGDSITLDASSVAGAFASKTAGTDKPVTVSGLALGGASAGNYAITQPAAAAAIRTKSLTVSGLTALNKTYDGSTTATLNPANAALVGVINGDTVTLGAGSATGAFTSASAGTDKLVTGSGFTLGGADAANYSLAAPQTTADITKATLMLMAENKSRTYGATNPTFTRTLTGFVNGETTVTANITGSGTLSTGATVTSDVGNHTIAAGVGDLAAANYSFNATDAIFTITKAPLTVTADNKSKVYGTANPLFSVTFTGFVNGDTSTVVSGNPALSTAATPASAVNTYAITAGVGTLSALNYAFTHLVDGSLTVTKAPLTITADNQSRGYGGANPTFTAAAAGFVNGDTLASAVTGSPAFADAATSASGVGSYTITPTLGTLAAVNYTFTLVAGTQTITPASAQVTVSGVEHTYNGSARGVTVVTTPAGLAHAVTYAGGAVPINAGSYAVDVSIVDANYTGSTAATLTIAKALQTVSLSVNGARTIGAQVALSAVASSGLPVTVSVVSGNATVSASALTLHDSGSVALRAVQGGNGNYHAALTEITTAATAKRAQLITFNAPLGRRSDAPAFALGATATSGLPVSFAIVSGPAVLSGDSLTLTGTLGTVTVRASQSGDTVHAAAPDVTVSFDVAAAGLSVFFGPIVDVASGRKNGDMAAALPPDRPTGSLLVVAPEIGVNAVLDFTLNAAGAFIQTVVIDAPVSDTSSENTRARAAAVLTLTVRGSITNGVLEGIIEPLGLSFRAPVLSPAGPSAGSAGFYRSSSIAAASGSTYSIVGTSNEVLVLSVTPDVTTGGMTTLNADGTFSLQNNTIAGLATIRGAVDEPNTTVAGTISLPGKPAIQFAGLASTTIRTDRLTNLSSRVRVGSVSGSTLITGFVIGGAQSKRVLLRAIGPSLTGFGITGALTNPRLELYNGAGERILQNEDWSGAETAAAFAQVGAFTLTAGTRDAALLATLAPGPYTMHVVDGGETGVALAEIYDASANPQGEYQRLINISTRGTVGSGEGALIGGFVVTGNSPKRVLVRAAGPSLVALGLSDALVDPKLVVYGGQTIVAQNNDWGTAAFVATNQAVASAADIAAAARATGAFAFASGSKDAAVIVTLAPGAYTAQVTSSDGTSTGAALVEIYEMPE